MVESSFNSDYYEDEGKKKPFIEKIKVATGAIGLALTIIIFFSLLSYFFTGSDDQSLIDSGLSFSSLGEESKNWLGVLGSFLSHYLMFVTFGISSFLIVPLLLVISIRFLFNKKIYSLSRISIFTFFGIIWISSLMGFFLNFFSDNFFLKNYTGGVGYNLSLFLNNLLGLSSFVILLLSLFLFIVFYYDLYSFSLFKIKRKKNDSISDNSKLHPHFQCSDCGVTKCLDQELSVPLVPNYKIDSAELLLTGQCENCLS